VLEQGGLGEEGLSGMFSAKGESALLCMKRLSPLATAKSQSTGQIRGGQTSFVPTPWLSEERYF